MSPPRRDTFTSEVELGKVVVAWLEAQHYDVYQEVQPEAGFGGVIDIVARQGARVTIVELKLRLGLKVIDQAWRWSDRAHLTYAAVPYADSPRSEFGFACRVAEKFGVGVLGVRPGIPDVLPPEVQELARPRFNRRPILLDRLLARLTEQHRTYAEAGNADGRRWTSFRATCTEMAAYVAQHPGASIREVMANVKHHYRTPATARSSMAQWLTAGKVPGIRLEREGRLIKLYPSEATP